MPRGAAMSSCFLCRLGETTALCSTGGGAPANKRAAWVVVKRAAEQPPLQPHMSEAYWMAKPARRQSLTTPIPAPPRGRQQAEVRRRPAAISGAGWLT